MRRESRDFGRVRRNPGGIPGPVSQAKSGRARRRFRADTPLRSELGSRTGEPAFILRATDYKGSGTHMLRTLGLAGTLALAYASATLSRSDSRPSPMRPEPGAVAASTAPDCGPEIANLDAL